MMKMPYEYGIKNRDWQTGEIKSLTVADNGIDLKDRTVLIVDDICSRGGTFIHSAKKLKELGAAKIYLYVTHCENTVLEGDLLKDDLVEHIFTTDSIFRKSHEKIEVFQI
jgi:ribose-phosphate pyrophosphokinase